MTVSEQIIEVLNALCEKFGIAIDWTASNMLPYVESLTHKFIAWEISTSVFWILFMTILTTASFLISKKIYAKYQDTKYDCTNWDIANIAGWIITICITLALVVTIGCQIHDIITCVTFPEMMLIEKIQGLMQTTG